MHTAACRCAHLCALLNDLHLQFNDARHGKHSTMLMVTPTRTNHSRWSMPCNLDRVLHKANVYGRLTKSVIMAGK